MENASENIENDETVLTDILTPAMVERMYATMDWPYLPADLETGQPAPLNSYLMLCIPLVANKDLRIDGLSDGDSVLPLIDLPRRVWGGSILRFHDPLRVGDTVQRRSRLTDRKQKTGSQGEMTLLTVIHDFYVGDRLCMTEELTLIYLPERPPGTAVESPPPTELPTAAYAKSVSMTDHQLFRFSAITFNAHRIHFDPHHAKMIEDYRDQVVHGPIMTSLILDLWQQQHPERDLTELTLRSFNSAYVNETLHVQGNQTASSSEQDELALYNDHGHVLLTAQARHKAR